MEIELGEKWLSESYRNSLSLELKTINSEIEKADSPPSQSNFEMLHESLLFAEKIIKSGSRVNYWIFIELWYCLSLVLATISEVDSPPLRLIIERLQSCSFFKEAILLRKFEHPPSPSHVTQGNKLYLYFCHSCGPIRYKLFEIESPTSAAERNRPKPILELKTSKYPDGMCCVQLGLQLYFFGGEFMNLAQNVLPQDVYVFNLTLYHNCHYIYRRMNEDMLLMGTPMHSGKASPLAFVADAKIYVIGSKLDDSVDTRLVYFESYDPHYEQWSVLPYPRIRGRHEWVGNAVVGRVAFLTVMQQGRRYVFRFNLDTQQWKRKPSSFDSHLRIFTGKIEFVENNFYGCCHNTLLKSDLDVLLEDLRGGEVVPEEGGEVVLEEGGEEEEEEGEEEWGEEDLTQEIELQQVRRLLHNYDRFQMVSRENGMNAIYNVPGQVQSSTTLRRLGIDHICYVRIGKRPQEHYDVDGIEDSDIPANRYHYTSTVIFRTAPYPRVTYEENRARSFVAQLVNSKHQEYYANHGEDISIKGCYSVGGPG